jgi:hypothetical protein
MSAFEGGNLRAFFPPGAAQPILYGDGFLPPSNTIPPTATKVSVDGGKTWAPVPEEGNSLYADNGIVGMLEDGSIVEEFGGHLFAWKVDDRSWHALTPGVPGARFDPRQSSPLVSLLILPTGAAGKAVFWAVIQHGTGNYSVYRYQQP